MGLLRAVGRTAVIAGTATAVSGSVARRQDQKWAAQDAQAQEASQQAAQNAAGDDITTQLENLANLHSQGILTDEEYAAAKAKALGI